MSEFLKYLRNILGFGISEEKNTQRNRKRKLIQEEFDNYSHKLRRLNDYKMSHHTNDQWSEITPSLKSNYIRHFPNWQQITEDKRHVPTIETIDISDEDDVIEVSPPKSYTSTYENGVASSQSSNILFGARQSINNCHRFLNRSNGTLRLDEHDIYRDMLLNSPRTSAAYINTSSLNKKYEENGRAKKILSLLNEDKTIQMNKDSDSTRKISPVNSMKKFLENEPFMDPNFLKKLSDEHASKRNETKRLIQEERIKREKFSEVNRMNANIILESLANKCKITDVILLKDIKEELIFPQFSSEQELEINNALKCRTPNRVYNDKYNLRITAGDLKLLNNKEWLNDELINFYVNMIQERSQNSKLPKVHAFSTFFYPKLVSSGYSSLRRWTKRVDIFSYDIIVVPVHLGFHWCMAIIDFRDKSIRYYDSMLGVNKQCLTSLEKYLQEEYRDKKKCDYDTSGWQKVIMKDIPRQMNGSDCGVFSCTFAEFITRNAKILFTQEHMPYIRRKMVIEIIQGKLLT